MPFSEGEDVSVESERGLIEDDVRLALAGVGGDADAEDVAVGGEPALVQDVHNLVPLGLWGGVSVNDISICSFNEMRALNEV